MKIGFKAFIINPPFPVNRMLSSEKHQKVSDDLHCRVLVLDSGATPFYHLSIDSVEVYADYRNQIKSVIEDRLGREIDLVVSATHSHYCPCLTTDASYRTFVLDEIRENIGSIMISDYKTVSYSYQYHFFDQVGKSRISGQESKNIFAETLSLYGDTKRVVTVLMHNVHPTTMPMHSGDFTSEYPGWVIKNLKEKYPEEDFTFMLGPAGEISSRFTRINQNYEEIGRLAQLLADEYNHQLENQTILTPCVSLKYQEIHLPIKRYQRDMSKYTMPSNLSDRELETIQQALTQYRPHDIDKMEMSHLFSQLIFSKEYSILFEPFELFSEYYSFIDKEHSSLITISNGFDHYLTGLGQQRLTMELFSDTVTDETKYEIVSLLARWSRQLS